MKDEWALEDSVMSLRKFRLLVVPTGMFVAAVGVLVVGAIGCDAESRRAMAHSLGVALLAVPVGAVIGSIVTFLLHRWRSGLGAIAVCAAIALPLIAGVMIRGMAGVIGADRGIGGLVIGHVIVCALVVGLVLRIRIGRIDPAVVEAAADLGAPPVEIVRRVLLPTAWPAIAAGALLALAASISDCMMASMVGPAGWSLLGTQVWAKSLSGQGGGLVVMLTLMDALLIVAAWRMWVLPPVFQPQFRRRAAR